MAFIEIEQENKCDFKASLGSPTINNYICLYFRFRVLTYNLLAQVYADTDLAREELFSHCPPHALEMDYRKHLLLKEIIGWHIICNCMFFIFHLTTQYFVNIFVSGSIEV